MPAPMAKNTFTTPRCLEFLDEPFVGAGDAYMTLAEIRCIREYGITGTSRIYTAFVPTAELARTLRLKARERWPMQVSDTAWGEREFRIIAPSGARLEPLVYGWTSHNRTVLAPNPNWLAFLGLVPSIRTADEPRIDWNDLEVPAYGVVRVSAVSKYEGPDELSGARVEVLRSYADRLAFERHGAIVAVYYEQRSLAHDTELEARLGGEEALYCELPGRTIEIKRTHDREFPYFVAAWGVRLLLKPPRRITSSDDDPKPALTWPGFPNVIDGNRAFMMRTTNRVYVRDEVLQAWEDRDEFEVDPIDGGIDYEGRWQLTFSNRVGRDYFSYELKKVYEGIPSAVTRHVHRFAVEPQVALDQERLLGNDNIGTRADKLIAAFHYLAAAIEQVGTTVGVDLDDEKIAKPTLKKTEYYGWWTMTEFKALGYRAPRAMSRIDFFRRTVTVAALIERFQERALRRIAVAIGIPSKQLKELNTIHLLGMLAVIGDLAHESGLTLSDAAGDLASRWNRDLRVAAVKILFAGRDLRDLASHATEPSAQPRIETNLRDIGIDPDEHRDGWGEAVDRLYEQTTESLGEIARLLREAC
jgi:hypothetical protein